jgi:hypothetical protein
MHAQLAGLAAAEEPISIQLLLLLLTLLLLLPPLLS